MSNPIQEIVTQAYVERYGEVPQFIVRAPGRVNLIGEHTDYNDGFVFPMAIDRAVWIAFSAREDDRVEIHSLDFDDPIQFDLRGIQKEETSPAEYVKGVAWALHEAGYALKGFQGVLKGDVPIGAGLSSSAALELAIARSFSAVADFPWDATKMALLAQKAENKWVGVNSGIMDQLISAAGQTDHALLIDCRSLEAIPTPLPSGTVIIVMDTGTRRGLVGSAYNERRQQCEAAAKFFGVPALRDVTLEQFEARQAELEPIIRKRAKHIITENDRTLQAKDAMFAGDAARLGQLMVASHVSMRDDFEISSDALNAMVESARLHPACYGARMTGGGFGGCAVALIDAAQTDDFVQQVTHTYITTTGNSPALYVCHPTAGAAVVE